MLDSKITFIHIRHGSFILEVFTLIFLRPNPLSPYQIQRLQSLKCMKHNETCKVSDWVEYVIWCVCGSSYTSEQIRWQGVQCR